MSAIRLHFTLDSKRRGQTHTASSLTAAKRAIRCAAGKPKKFTPVKMHGYSKAWEVTCGDTVVADAFEVSKPRRLDHPVNRKKRGRR